MFLTLDGHGATVILSMSHSMMTPWIRCEFAGGCFLEIFIWNPRMELMDSKVSNPELAEPVGSIDP